MLEDFRAVFDDPEHHSVDRFDFPVNCVGKPKSSLGIKYNFASTESSNIEGFEERKTKPAIQSASCPNLGHSIIKLCASDEDSLQDAKTPEEKARIQQQLDRLDRFIKSSESNSNHSSFPKSQYVKGVCNGSINIHRLKRPPKYFDFK